jgi:hypothetical protein
MASLIAIEQTFSTRIGAAAQRGTAHGTLRTQSEFLDVRGAELALALVTCALEQLALLVLAHLLAALLDHAAHERPRMRFVEKRGDK